MDEIKRLRKLILKRSNEILNMKARINKLQARILDEQISLAIAEKDLLNMQLNLDGKRGGK